MAKEILNRRQNIIAGSIPPEIPSGAISATDYATSTKGGTIKVDSTYAIELTSGGKLKAKEITAEGYAEANDAAFVSKATLDNVIAALPQPTTGGMTLLYESDPESPVTSGNYVTLTDDPEDYAALFYVCSYGSGAEKRITSCLFANLPGEINLGWIIRSGGSTTVTSSQIGTDNQVKIYDSIGLTYEKIYGLK